MKLLITGGAGFIGRHTFTGGNVRGMRDTEFEHKVFLFGGASNMIIDCLVSYILLVLARIRLTSA